jgi:hypothetical protein
LSLADEKLAFGRLGSEKDPLVRAGKRTVKPTLFSSSVTNGYGEVASPLPTPAIDTCWAIGRAFS